MANERQAPDTIAAIIQLSPNDVTYIDEDPDSPDGLWLVASGNNVNTSVRVTFPTPTGDPTVGVDLQEFRAYVRQFDLGQTGDPEARIDLYENGGLLLAGTDVPITGAGQIITLNWNANLLGTSNGSLVEARVVGTKAGGAPAARNSVDVGAVEWNVEYTAAGLFYQQLDATTTPSALLKKKTTRDLVATTAPSASITKLPKKKLAATTIPSAGLLKKGFVTLAATTQPLASIIKKGFVSLVATTTPLANLGTQFRTTQLLAATTTPLASLGKKVGKMLAATTTPLASISKFPKKKLAATTTPSASVGTSYHTSKTVVATTTPLATITKSFKTFQSLIATTTPLADLATQFMAYTPVGRIKKWILLKLLG